MKHFKQIIEEVGDLAMQQREQTIRETMSLNLKEFAGKVAAFNKLGEALYKGGNFADLAEQLEEIATHAEAYTLRETEESPFDQITIKRNMKELKGYTSEFKKVAAEARSLQERMTALYEDSGRVLGRYFEIKEMGQPDGMSTEPGRSENEKIVNANPGIREDAKSDYQRTVREIEAIHYKMKQRTEAMKTMSPDAKKVAVEQNKKDMEKVRQLRASIGSKPSIGGDGYYKEGVHEGKMCEGCGKPMEQCECMNEGETLCPGCDKPMSQCECEGHVHESVVNEDEKWIQKAVNPKHKGYCTPMTKSTCTPARKALAKRFKKGIEGEGVNEGKMSLRKLMEDINDDRPKEDWVKLDVPMLRYDVAKKFESDLKKKGFTVKRFDWKERTQAGQEFSEFFVRLKDFDEANKYAVGAYQSFDNNSRMGEE